MSLPLGFRVGGVHAGVKAGHQNKDLALFWSDVPAAAAGVFTLNKVCGAPVKLSRQRLPSDHARCVIINSGNANACTGEKGIEDAEDIAEQTANIMGCSSKDVLICSTGVIGRFLPMQKFYQAIPKLPEAIGNSEMHLETAARSIMTTDTVPKFCHRQFMVDGKKVTITGVCKGAAMIMPNMATMLGVILTDAAISKHQADTCLRVAVNQSFNCISVEGHTSTSDSVILLANGQSGTSELSGDGLTEFQMILNEVATELAQKIVRDAEGADHYVTIDVDGLPTYADAMHVAKTIANDALVKTAITGNDPNWGRIISACGRTGMPLTEKNISLSINGMQIFKQGSPTDQDVKEVSDAMKSGEVRVELTFDLGKSKCRVWTCDLTQEYVHLNADYTT